MKKQVLCITILFCCLAIVGQNNKELFSVNKKTVSVSEFKRVYEKNLGLVVDEDSKDIDKYLDLYINYKLKVNEAYALGLDTVSAYKRELEGYKKQLIAPYLQDQESINRLVKEAYFRVKNEVKASHILVRLPKRARSSDTLKAYNKIIEIRNRVVSGESFAKVAREVSEDPSAEFNGGNLGYFSAFKMVYPFEDNAYKTNLNGVSNPFKTRFGYHILKVTGKRKSKGEFEVAHILARDRSIVGKAKIDSLYKKIKNGKSFEEIAKKYSEDVGTAQIGGRLPKFGTGKMVEDFEKNVLKLKIINEVSKPFKTKFGWHIVKLVKNYPIASFEEMKVSIEKKIKSSDRLRVSQTAVLNKLKKEYDVRVYDKNLELFTNKSIDELSKMQLAQDNVLAINDKKIKQKAFYDYIKYRKKEDVTLLFERFKNEEIFNYFKEDLINREPEFRHTLTEYKEGLLLFELMQQKIWNKSANDSIGLQRFFDETKEKYKQKELEDVKGEVISDYQKKLEDDWIQNLRKNNVIRIRKREVKKLKQTYNQ
ncbi:peptidylprolyl isomerase [Tenacibaculum sp. nBUS_03]|uniref:peptidylprolyl isomerase n=1 Tax=Tenacibaculum sp. nBUS_03 TaxID=3395320 RepID=UPI003EC07C91